MKQRLFTVGIQKASLLRRYHHHGRLSNSITKRPSPRYYTRLSPVNSCCSSPVAATATSNNTWSQHCHRGQKRSYSVGSTNCNNSVGLYSIPELQQPSDFVQLTKHAIHEANSLRNSIPEDNTTTSLSQAVETLYQLDEISQKVCNVIDAAELCRSTHASQEWRHAASIAFEELQCYIGNLNSDERLYNALREISQRADFPQLNEEQQRFCVMLKKEFETDGIHLPEEQRENLQSIHHRITQLETLFANNITNSVKKFTVQASDVESIIPRHVLEANGAVYSNDSSQEIQLYADTPITHSIMSYASDGNLREHVHMETTTKCVENLDVLDALIGARQELAKALNFESYAHRFLQDKMINEPQDVQSFLKELQTSIQPEYYKELGLIRHVKKQIEGSESNVVVEPWDIKFYVKLIKAQSLNRDNEDGDNELSKYWSLSNSIKALQLLTKELFGIEMTEEEIGDNERWDILDDGHPVPKGDQAIRKFTFWDRKSENQLGTMYLDLSPRPGKYTHAAHFTVRCGCRTGSSNHSSNGNDDNFQLPIVALVCNMNLGGSGISHQEVETLYHEFGHALHSLLSRTSFQHLSGTRGAMDFVETPSHLIENFVWDPNFLKLILARDASDNPMPDETIQALVKSRNAFRCLEIQNQIVLSMFDQSIFGHGDAGKINTLDVWEALHQQNHVPYAKGTHWYSNVGHLVTYGAGYYGYLYSQVFADAIWQHLFQTAGEAESQDGTSMACLNQASGDKLWKQVLIHGGSKDPNIMLKDLLGKKPTFENYWKSSS